MRACILEALSLHLLSRSPCCAIVQIDTTDKLLVDIQSPKYVTHTQMQHGYFLKQAEISLKNEGHADSSQPPRTVQIVTT
ncbi:hypothetical protein M758_9G052400 [Ceratodon purpureus]|nr:hypothetical protein M758_9G052400 [Ceratodon purpureus]